MPDTKCLRATIGDDVHGLLKLHAVRRGVTMPEAVGEVLEQWARAVKVDG